MVSKRCRGITNCNKRCKNKVHNNFFCGVHKNQIENCAICLEDIESKCTLESCKHTFCKMCILKWMCKGFMLIRPTCPLCRCEITDEDLNTKSINYGIKQKLFIYINKIHYNTDNLSYDEMDILEDNDIRPLTFITVEQWESIKPNLEFVDKMETWTAKSILRLNNESDWEYFNTNNTIVFFE